MSIGSISDCLASSIAFSEVPPMPMPSIPGGHQPAPMVGTVFSTHSTTESVGLSMTNFDFGFRASALGRDGDFDRRAAHQFDGDDGGRVVFGVFARARGIGQHGCAQLVVGIEIGAAHALVDHLLQVHGFFAGARLEAHVHAQLDEGVHDARVLADGPVALGAHAAVDEDLRHGVARRRRLLALVGLGERGDVIHRVVVADVLQRARNAGDEIFLPDDGHGGSLHSSRVFDARVPVVQDSGPLACDRSDCRERWRGVRGLRSAICGMIFAG